MIPKTIEWIDGRVRLIDQTKLPNTLEIIECKKPETLIEAIKEMKIRGAPAIGAAAAMAIALSAETHKNLEKRELIKKLKETAKKIRETRPTARNLFWATERILKKIKEDKEKEEIIRQIIQEAEEIAEEDIEINMKIGEKGAELIEDGETILTYCNAGSLATVYYGTALGVIRSAWRQGKKIKVIAVIEEEP